MAKIFLIEYDPEFADVLQLILGNEGHEVTCNRTVNEALLSSRVENPDLVILDLNSGSNTNREQLRKIVEAQLNCPILVTAAYKAPDNAFAALGSGADDYILKPFSTCELLGKIQQMTVENVTPDGTDNVEKLSNSIKLISSVEDIIKITIDQLAHSLHLTDCLIALSNSDSFNIIASRGYDPDPTSRSLSLPKSALIDLNFGVDEPFAIPTETAHTVVSKLGIHSHRPFPTIMPLISNHESEGSDSLLGFVMGHGALVLEETDILEMELFLARIATELSTHNKINQKAYPEFEIEHQGVFEIPTVSRDRAITKLLAWLEPYFMRTTDLFWIRLVLDEAINNAIIHGHKEPLNKPVARILLYYRLGPSRIEVSIEDSGKGFDHANVPDPTADENLLSVNGRGIFLMRNIMDKVFFNDKGNIVTLVKNLDGSPLGPSRPGILDNLFF